jgi:hypothetical protein
VIRRDLASQLSWHTEIVRKVVVLVIVAGLAVSACQRDDEITIGSTAVPSSSPATSTSLPASTSAPTTAPATTQPPTSPTIEATTTVAPTSPPTTTLTPTTTLAPTTTTTTTLAPGACSAVPPFPAGAVESASKLIDVDADGVTDTGRTYSVGPTPGAGAWHIRVELAAGGGADYTVPTDPAPAAVKLLGATYVGSTVEPGPGGMRPVIFVTTGAGASASIVTLFRFDGCTLVKMGGGAEFPVGAGVMHADNLRCEGVAGTSLLVHQSIQSNDGGVTFDVTDTAYTRTGNDLTVYGAGPQTTNQPTMPTVPTLIDCPGVDHP